MLNSKSRTRQMKGQKAREHREELGQSVQAYLVPALVNIGFVVDLEVRSEAGGKYRGTFPSWGQLVRTRGATKHKVAIQFSTYGRAAFTINVSTWLQMPTEKLLYSFCTDARARLRPVLRALQLGNQGSWFFLPFWRFRSPMQAKYDKLAMEAASIVPEIDQALIENKTGPHILHLYEAKHE